MSDAFAHLPYRRGVGVMLLNARGEVFVARRIDTTAEAWQMPQGGIDAGEDPETAALRELEEETGLKPEHVQILARAPEWLRYDLPAELVPVIWKGKYRGQEQAWFAMRLVGDERAINIATAHPEFSEWKWLPMQQLPEVIVPFKRALYAQIVRVFEHAV
jgi:putative (di)nucleoside polyphosphate hydrolase